MYFHVLKFFNAYLNFYLLSLHCSLYSVDWQGVCVCVYVHFLEFCGDCYHNPWSGNERHNSYVLFLVIFWHIFCCCFFVNHLLNTSFLCKWYTFLPWTSYLRTTQFFSSYDEGYECHNSGLFLSKAVAVVSVVGAFAYHDIGLHWSTSIHYEASMICAGRVARYPQTDFLWWDLMSHIVGSRPWQNWMMVCFNCLLLMTCILAQR